MTYAYSYGYIVLIITSLAFSTAVRADDFDPSLPLISDCEQTFSLLIDPTKPVMVIIHGLSSGQEFATEGPAIDPAIQAVHVSHTRYLPSILKGSYHPEHYAYHYVADDDRSFEALIAMLETIENPQKNLRIIAGTETSPVFRAKLTNRLNLPGADLALAEARVDKEKMIKAVAEEIRRHPPELSIFATVPTFGASTMEEALHELTKRPEWQFPLFTKPTMSAASHGIRKIETLDDLAAAFDIIGTKDPIDNIIDRLLVQPYVEFSEYDEMVVDYIFDDGSADDDSVDDEDELFVSPNHSLYKKDADRHYISTTVMPENENQELHAALNEVGKLVAKALGKHNALGHLELFVRKTRNADGKFVILFGEDGERAAGSLLTRMVRGTGRTDVVRLHIMQQFARDQFKQAVADINDYPNRTMLVASQVEINRPEGFENSVIKRLPTLQQLQKDFPELGAWKLHGHVGDHLGTFINGDIVAGLGAADLYFPQSSDPTEVLAKYRKFERDLFAWMTAD